MTISNFTYLSQGVHQINNEPIVINSNRIYLLHDNCSNISVYSGLDSTGSMLSGFTVNQDETLDYEYYLLFDNTTTTNYNGQTVYCNYTSTGDVCDSKMLTELRSELIRIAGIVDSQSSTTSLRISNTTPIADTSNYNGSTVSFVTNKWLKKNQNNSIKVYSDSNRTNEIAGTVTMNGDDGYTWTASSPLVSSSMYYVRIFSGLSSVDGTQLSTNYDFAFRSA